MKPGVALLAILLLASGCGVPVPHASALQQFDALGPRLRLQQTYAQSVAHNWTRLAASVSRARRESARRAASHIVTDSNRLSAGAAELAAKISTIQRSSTPGVRRRYFGLLKRALGCQLWEAREVIWTAELVWHDPLLEDGTDAARLDRLSAMARRSARLSVRLAGEAQHLEHLYRRSFRYVPIVAGA